MKLGSHPEEQPLRYAPELASQTPREEEQEHASKTEAESAKALANEVRKHNRTLAAWVVGFVAALAVMMDAVLQMSTSGARVPVWGVWVYLGVVITGIFSIRRHQKRFGKFARAMREKADREEKQEIGALLQALRIENQTTQEAATESLIRLLSLIHSEDRAMLPPHVRAQLRSLLLIDRSDPLRKDILYLTASEERRKAYNQREIDFRLAILHALAQVGDKEDLHAMEQLAQKPSLSGGQEPLRRAAETYLPQLRERVLESEERRSLLRASSQAEASPETLLRPAHNQADSPETLLRPQNEPEA